jgi:transcriptional regulator with XRE-family HTH domain
VKLNPERVLWARESRGYSIETTAAKAGMSHNSVMRAERGEEIRPSTARRLAEALGVEVSDLYPKAGASLSSLGFTEDEQQRRVQAFLGRHPSDTRRIAVAEGIAGVLEGYYRRWNTDLDRHIEEDTFPYGMGLEVGVFHDKIARSLVTEGIDVYAGWASRGGEIGISEREASAARRVVEAIKEAQKAVMRVEEVEKGLRSGGYENVEDAWPELARARTESVE